MHSLGSFVWKGLHTVSWENETNGKRVQGRQESEEVASLLPTDGDGYGGGKALRAASKRISSVYWPFYSQRSPLWGSPQVPHFLQKLGKTVRPKLPWGIMRCQDMKLTDQNSGTGEEIVLIQDFLRGPQLLFLRVVADMFPVKPSGGVLEK